MIAHSSPDADPRFTTVIEAVESVRTDRLTMDQALALMGDRSFAGVMLVLALPAMFMPPGVAALLGAPLVLICAQMVFARPSPWLPHTVRRRSIRTTLALKIARRVSPLVDRHRRHLRPRLHALFSPIHDRMIALICTGLSVVLIFPAPFAHAAAGLSVATFGAGLIRKDGAALLVGWALAAICAVLIAAEVGGAIYGAKFI